MLVPAGQPAAEFLRQQDLPAFALAADAGPAQADGKTFGIRTARSLSRGYER